MMLFPTRKPRQFRYTPRYSRRQGFDFHSGRRPVRRQHVLLLVVLLLLLLAFMVLLKTERNE